MKFVYYFYFKIYNFSKGISDDAFNEIKPVFFMAMLSGFFLVEILNWLSVILKEKIVFTHEVNAMIVFSIFYVCYLVFIRDNNWKKHILDFNKLPKPIRKKWDALIIFIILFIIVSFAISMYEFKTICMGYKKVNI